MRPEIKILAVSNVYSRLMHFHKKGDQELGHLHQYDHGTLLASGKVRVEKLNEKGEVYYTKDFTAPTFLFIDKNARHVITALEDNTVATFIHALRSVEQDIVDPDFLIEEKELADSPSQTTETRRGIGETMRDKGLTFTGFVPYPGIEEE